MKEDLGALELNVIHTVDSPCFGRLGDDELLRICEFLLSDQLQIFQLVNSHCHNLTRHVWCVRLAKDFGVALELCTQDRAVSIYRCLRSLRHVGWSPDVATHELAPRISPLLAVFGGQIVICGGSTRPLSSQAFDPLQDLLPHRSLLVGEGLAPVKFKLIESTGDAPTPRLAASSEVVRGSMLLWGGFSPDTEDHQDITLHSLSLREFVWSAIPVQGEPPESRFQHSLCQVDQEVVVFGGLSTNTHGPVPELAVLRMHTSPWRWDHPSFAGLAPEATQGLIAVPCQGLMVVVGVPTKVPILRVSQRLWEHIDITSTVQLPLCAAAVAVGSNVLVFGGIDIDGGFSNQAIALDLQARETRLLSDSSPHTVVPRVRSGLALSSCGTEVFLFGGCDEQSGALGDLHTLQLATTTAPTPSCCKLRWSAVACEMNLEAADKVSTRLHGQEFPSHAAWRRSCRQAPWRWYVICTAAVALAVTRVYFELFSNSE
eukprot:TRINITY_DN9386_c0_g1_i4.p1 TRINITY_DN9386_c0_g1~~TRINITY_DN9386_c0_g1_i4.p1  ORF type:complete len:487 (+),score=61.05 TRINITY_DN9386_c0_g1_i4:140-1600(+)